MKLAILEDAALHPKLFFWVGPVSNSKLVEFLRAKEWQVPTDLFELWEKTGGGDFFDSETLFAPLSDVWADDSLEAVNSSLWSKGMPREYLALHDGIKFTALNLRTGRYCFLEERAFGIT